MARHTDDHETWLRQQQSLLNEAELNLSGHTIHYAEIERVGRWLHHIRLCHRPPAIPTSDGRLIRGITMETIRLGGYALGRKRAERKAARQVAREYRRDVKRGGGS